MEEPNTPEAVVRALYDVISGPAGEERDWDRFRSLFLPGARISAFTTLPDGTPQEGVWTLDEYVPAAAEFYAEAGFWEEELWSRSDRFGNVAHVLSTYESRVGSADGEPVGRGVNSVQMLCRAGRWRIAAIAFELEGPGRPIPDRYLGENAGER